jgi:hypothetical protein
MTRGIYRERIGNQNSVCIRYDDGDEIDLPEDKYRAQGYDPPFDKLPWKGADATSIGGGRVWEA